VLGLSEEAVVTSRARPRLVGAFVVVGVLMALGTIAALSSAEYRTYVVFFPRAVGGLKPGAPLTFRQVPVGQVREVELVYTGKDALDMQIMAVVELRRNAVRPLVTAGLGEFKPMSDAAIIKTFVDGGLRASIRSSSPVAGQKSVDLDFHPELPARFAGAKTPYPEIPTAPTGMEVLNEKIEAMLKKLTDVPIDEVLLQLKATLESTQNLIDSGDVRGALSNLRLTLETANQTLKQAEKTIGGVDGMVSDVRTTLGHTDQSVASLKSTLDQMNQTLVTVERNVERSADVQRDASKTMDEVGEVMKSLRSLLDVLQRHPEALLRGKAEPEEKK
jgi:paraquat-inducible protein B